MTPQERVLNIARGEIGVTEYPPGSNKVKYNTWFYGKEVSGSSYPWCCSWLNWIFDQASCLQLIRRTSGCTTLMNWFKAKGQLIPIKEAKPSDIAFFQFDNDVYADHVGIIEKVTKTGVVTIEGNTSATSDDNGGAVMRRTRRWGVIMAVARPAYETIKEDNGMTKKEIEDLVKATVEKEIKPLNDALAKAIKELYPTTYTQIDKVPPWAKKAVNHLIQAGIIEGDGVHEINLTSGAMNLGTVSALHRLLEKIAPD